MTFIRRRQRQNYVLLGLAQLASWQASPVHNSEEKKKFFLEQIKAIHGNINQASKLPYIVR